MSASASPESDFSSFTEAYLPGHSGPGAVWESIVQPDSSASDPVYPPHLSALVQHYLQRFPNVAESSSHVTDSDPSPYPCRKREHSGEAPEASVSISEGLQTKLQPYDNADSTFSKRRRLDNQYKDTLPDFASSPDYPAATGGTVDVFGQARHFTVNGGTFNISHTSTTHTLPPPPATSEPVTDTIMIRQPSPPENITPASSHPRTQETGHTLTLHTSSSIPPSDGPVWSESEVYARLLLPKRHGYPLWIPEPYEGVSPEYELDGVRIGDVGIVDNDGGFQFLFNACHSSQSPINRDGVPEGFVPFPSHDLNILQRPMIFGRDTHITSAHFRKRTMNEPLTAPNIRSIVSFESSNSEGAILALPEGGSRTNAQNLTKLRQYAIHNARSWYKYANGERGWEIQNDSLYLITGCDKCICWAMASFSDGPCDSNETTSLELTTLLEDGPENGETVTLVWKERNSTAAVRTGPHCTPANSARTRPNNQCVFVRGYKIAIGMGTRSGTAEDTSLTSIVTSSPESLLGKGAGTPYGLDSGYFSGTSADKGSNPSSDSSTSSGTQHSSTQRLVMSWQFPEQRAIFHPSDIINRYLLAQSHSAEAVALTHDDDWCYVLNEDDTSIPPEQELLSRIQSQFDVHYYSDGIFFLCPEPSQSYFRTLNESSIDKTSIDFRGNPSPGITAEADGSAISLLDTPDFSDASPSVLSDVLVTPGPESLSLIDPALNMWTTSPSDSTSNSKAGDWNVGDPLFSDYYTDILPTP